MNTSSIATPKRSGFGETSLRLARRLVRAVLKLFAAALALLALVLMLGVLWVATKPVQVSDGVAPAWQAVRAHLTDMKRWDSGCWTLWGYAQVYVTPAPVIHLIRMDFGQAPADPAFRQANLRALYFVLAFGNAKSPLVGPEQGHRQFVCYITPPEYRTVAELASYPWLWETDPNKAAP